MNLKNFFNRHKDINEREKRYYEQTINKQKRQNKVNIKDTEMREIEKEWWRPLTYIVSFGSWLHLIIYIQFLIVSFVNIRAK